MSVDQKIVDRLEELIGKPVGNKYSQHLEPSVWERKRSLPAVRRAVSQAFETSRHS